MSGSTHKNVSPLPYEDPSGTWDAIFSDGIEKDDELWKQYLDFATEYDNRLIDDWNKIVDTILVYVALFIAILTAFIIDTSKNFQRDPGDITNDLLVAIYTQLTNNSAPVVDPQSFFNVDTEQFNSAIFQNSLLFASLAISILISVLASLTKLWLLRYSRKVSAPGPPYKRAMRRHEAFRGIWAWKLHNIVESLPVMVTLAVILFGIFIHADILKDQRGVAFAVGIILGLGLVFLLMTSIIGAFIPASPFQSSFSDLIRNMYRIFPDYPLTRNDTSPTIIRISGIMFASLAVIVTSAYLSQRYSSGLYQPLVCFSAVGVFALMSKHPKKHAEMKPRLYDLPEWAIFSTITISGTLLVSAYLAQFIVPNLITFGIAGILLVVQGYFGIKLSRFVPETTMAEAAAWMLRQSSAQYTIWFQKAGGIGSTEIKKAVLFKDLLPLLAPLITSIPHQSVHKPLNQDQVIYVACLARFCQYTPSSSSFWKNEVEFHRPVFSHELRNTLEKLRDCSHCPPQVCEAARVALELSGGKELEGHHPTSA
ncbi:hypothetical protein GALMADRAFT_237028 [Galerina marginata CBS 339.88]|uniref:DUF6535 domain-containing protein n=1 Tax=Galerina marginata (strain CBS 339.88) TaxID=685588 RepID=A0A067TYY3_GALM3|nr:hypothetical protein GALMADRAFT_237028 [Galerina marginata CBS 339.88]